MHQVLQKYPDNVRLVYRHFSRNEVDEKAGMAAECAGDQNKFWQMYDAIYSDDEGTFDYLAYAKKAGVNVGIFNQCIASNKYQSKVDRDTEMGRTLGIQGTPTFIVNGEMIVGYRPYSFFESMVKKSI
ncbi:MAG: DsbA family protein [Spirochaetia bacterium]|nr:DsbA family protein [Spirochaetia bacterium]